MLKPLIPRTIIDSEGKIYYSESFQAWNTIKLKKELFSEFPQLKEKRSKFLYKLNYFRKVEELQLQLKNIIKENGIPLLLWFYKDE